VAQAERLARRHWTLVYLKRNPTWSGEAVLVDKRGSRSSLLIPELELETQLYLNEDVPLDSLVSLRLSQVDLPELEVHFQVQGYKIPRSL
jgi:exoribonuclease-2